MGSSQPLEYDGTAEYPCVPDVVGRTGMMRFTCWPASRCRERLAQSPGQPPCDDKGLSMPYEVGGSGDTRIVRVLRIPKLMPNAARWYLGVRQRMSQSRSTIQSSTTPWGSTWPCNTHGKGRAPAGCGRLPLR